MCSPKQPASTEHSINHRVVCGTSQTDADTRATLTYRFERGNGGVRAGGSGMKSYEHIVLTGFHVRYD